jgi:ABC-2 type transport system ATP-binding protein
VRESSEQTISQVSREAAPPAKPIIEVDNVGIRFVKSRRRQLKLRDMFIHGKKRQPSSETFWPLRNLSFQIQPGEAVGVIGKNGTGKSTLLRLIAGVLIPDEGSVTVRGAVAPLLELSAGFSGDLTGRENVHLVGSLHGLSQAFLKRKFDEIVEFAHIGRFIDSQVGHYSSGQFARLGFADAVHVDSDIFLIDEVLAVGDKPFKRKCMEKIQEIRKEGRTLFYVSHAPGSVRKVCDRVLVLEEGRLVFDGGVDEGINFLHYDDPGDSDTDDELGADV